MLMISFIVIGRNENWRLDKCLESVFRVIEINNLRDSEVIYVDSKSTDDSIQRALSFKNVKVYQIKGLCNSAVGRNIGAQEAGGDILFFIDGDMEIQPEFIPAVIDSEGNTKYDCATGHLIDCFYDIDDNYVGKKPRTYSDNIPSENIELFTNGGLLITKKKIWDHVGGMRTKYKRSQDHDLSLRLIEAGYNIVRVPQLAAIHNTIGRMDEEMIWRNLRSGFSLYSSVLLRDHLNNPKLILKITRNNFTSIPLIIVMISLFINTNLSVLFVVAYLIIVSIRLLVNTKASISRIKKNILRYYLERLLVQFIRDASFLLTFVFFYPRNGKVQYNRINSCNNNQ